MSIGEVWEQYKKQRDGDYFTDNASFVFVPTASGARGYDAVRQFLSTAYDSRTISVKEKIIVITTGENSIVEESETTITFNSGDGAWLAPGVDSRFMIDSQVVIPTITSASFDGDRISSIRVYWDQASVLKQLRLITKDTWPIVGERQVDTVRNISSAHLNPFGKTDRLAAGVAKMSLNQQQQEGPGRRSVHTTSRVNQPGGTGGRSTIFDDMSDPNQDSTSSAHLNKTDHLAAGVTNTNLNQQQQEGPGRRPIHTSSRVNQPGGTGGRSTIFDDMSDPNQDSSQRFMRTSSRVNQPGGAGGKSSSLFDGSEAYDDNTQRSRFNSNKNASQFSIGNTDEGDQQQDNSSISGSSRRRGKSQFESSVEFGDDGGSQPPQRSSVKPSSRPPGGGSQFTLG